MAFDFNLSEVVDKIMDDPKVLSQFKEDPVKAVEKVLGVDLPDDIINKVIAAVKAKLTADTVSGAFDALKKLF